MAVVMIRESARPRIRALAAKMGWDLRKARGCVVGLWDESQSLKVWCASREEVLFWSDEHDPQVGEKLLAILQDPLVKLISPLPDGTFEILGNRQEIERVLQVRAARQKAAYARWHVDADEDDVDSTLDANADANASHVQSESYSDAMPKPSQAKPSKSKPSQAEKTPPDGGRERPGRSRAPYADFLSAWNANRRTLAAINEITDGRKTKIRARWAEKPELAYWEGCVRRMAASKFCCESGWATFDWLVKNDTNHTKVAAGNYDNRDDAGGERDPYEWMKFLSPEERARLDADEKKREVAHGQS